MEQKDRKTGIEIAGDIPWGTHLCQFYKTKEDLIEILVPYFKAGIENNEYCIWVTSDPLNDREAEEALRKDMPDYDQYLERGQIEIIPHKEWYLKGGTFEFQRVLADCMDKLNIAKASGYDGIRVTGNTAWLEKRDWPDFCDYEETLNNVIGQSQIVAICTYSLDKCGAPEVIDVLSNHEFALIRRDSNWVKIEDSTKKQTKEALIESEKRLRVFMDMAPDAFSLFDSELNLVKINKAGLKMFPAGAREKDVIGKNITELYPGIFETGRYDTYREVIKTGKSFFAEDIAPKPSFGMTGVAVTAFKIGDGLGLIVTNLTERKRLERALQKSEAEYRSTLEDLHVEEAPIDQGRGLSSSNRVIYGVTGYISVETASQRYGLSGGRIRQLLRAKRLVGRKFGNAWAVSIASLESYTPFPQKAPKTKKRSEGS